MDKPADNLRDRLVADLVAAGHLPSQEWRDAFQRVPRHEFVPRFFRSTLTGAYRVVEPSDPDWLQMVYTDDVLATQLDGDDSMWEKALSAPVKASATTSSSSQPQLMAEMLEALDVRYGHRVLEVGTGTGYNAALLTHRLGPDLVTTVDVDPGIVTAATQALHRCGYTPTTAVVDGLGGYPPHAPYDRIIATCSVTTIPPAWVDQTQPGGLILANLYRELGGPLVRLRVTADGIAQGHFLTTSGGFMPARAEEPPEPVALLQAALRSEADPAPRPTPLDPATLKHPDVGMVIALLLPDVTQVQFFPASGPQLWLLAADGSWARLDEPAGTVAQHGRQQLWDRVEAVHLSWRAADSPARDRYGLTVTPDRQWVWLDEPDNPVPTR